MKCLGQAHADLDAGGLELLAVSGDPVETQSRFVKTLGLPFRVLSDPELAVAKAYGVLLEPKNGNYAGRSVFLIDRAGKVQYLDRAFGVPETLAGTPLLAAIRKLTDDDALAPLAARPEAEREALTLLVRRARAVLDEDLPAAQRLLHPDFAAREKWTAWHEQLFAARDLAGKFKLADALDLSTATVVAGADAAARAQAAGATVATAFEEGDVVVTCRTKKPPTGTDPYLPDEIVLLVRRSGGRLLVVAERLP